MKVRFTNEWLRRRIERDADLDSDAGLPITKIDLLKALLPEAPAVRTPVAAAAPQVRQSAAVLGHLVRQLRRRDRLELARLSAEVRVPEQELREIDSHANGPGQYGEVERQARCDFIKQRQWVETLAITFVDERDNRNMAQAAHLKQFAGCADPGP